jgi:hypothetical protein
MLINRGPSSEANLLQIVRNDKLKLQLFLEDVNTRAVWKVRRLTLLLRVETLWRCSYGLFLEVPPLASDALLTTLHPLSRKRAADRLLQASGG